MFVPAGAPKFEARTIQDSEGTDVTVVVEVGAPSPTITVPKDEPPAAAPAPKADAPAPKPEAPAPKPPAPAAK